ncbi:helix-turn-helix domain-containing protein [Marinobacter sp.]|uniref:helix-turn-helix domain-containing protein n=1 Tax=Marinobacter sp. TaxID=50741 RepID=UPI003A9348D3
MAVLNQHLFVDRLKECISASEWSREALAQELGVSMATLGRWLTQGKTFQYPSLPQFVELCDRLGVSQQYITLGVGGMCGPHDGRYREMYRRYVEDLEMARAVHLLAALSPEVLRDVTSVLAHLPPAPPTTE